jgi:hypothetical protein
VILCILAAIFVPLGARYCCACLAIGCAIWSGSRHEGCVPVGTPKTENIHVEPGVGFADLHVNLTRADVIHADQTTLPLGSSTCTIRHLPAMRAAFISALCSLP